MIEIITNSFAFISTTVYYVFLLSHKVGQFIIEALSYALQFLRIACNNIFTVLTVIFEDFYIFVTDIMHHMDSIVSAFQSAIAITAKHIFIAAELLKFIILSIYNVILVIPTSIIAGVVFKAMTNITYLVSVLKRMLILFGSGIWFALTLLPLFVVYSLSMCAYFVGNVLQEIADLIQRGTTQTYEVINGAIEFVTDVPFEATAGLAVGCCILYVLIKFHLVMYRILEEKFWWSVRHLNLRLGCLRQRLRVKKHSHPAVPSETSAEASRNVTYDSRYCIICQEHYKCVLMLPCKHVCVCSDCSKRLSYFDNTCPLCRREVKKTMKVFV